MLCAPMPLRRSAARWFATLALLLAAAALAPSCHRSSSAAPALELSPCRPKGVSEEVRCGTLNVPEDRAKPNGRTLGLHVAVVPALSAAPKPDALFILAGGPGQAAAELIGPVLPLFEKEHRERDIVFVDQRGTGKSSPLACEASEDAGLAERFSEGIDAPALHACLDGYRKAGIDVRQYLTPTAMDDLDAVRAALGYDRIDLWGASYGTRAALVYLRRHPEHVRVAVLDGVYPTDISLLLTAAQDGQRAFDLIFDACAKDPVCNAKYPALKKQFTDLLARLDAEPAHTTVADPLTGAPTELTLTRSSFVENLHGLLYVPEIGSLLPLIVQRASHGDFAPFVAQAAGLGGGIGADLFHGMFFSVLCAEDGPAATPEARARVNTPQTYFGDAFAQQMLQVCAFWPRGELPKDFHQPVHAKAPVLLLSGALDPITPPVRGEHALQTLPHGRHIVVPGVGHGTTMRGCVADLVDAFIESGTAKGLDAGCVGQLDRPPFFVGFAGPTP